MQNATGREGEATEFDSYSTPPAAKAYFLRIQEPRAHQIGTRNLGELRMLATALDHMAQGRTSEAADVLAQRVIAMEISVQDGNWSRACFLELTQCFLELTQEDRTLAGPELQMLANKEAENREKLARPAGQGPPRGGGWPYYQNNWKGQTGDGKGKKGQGKGKGAGKGKKGDGAAAPAPAAGAAGVGGAG